MANLRTAQKEMTRRLLLSTALGLFETKGYAATTVDDIARAAGTTRATFYAYFSSRTDLMRALIEQLNELLGRDGSPDRGWTSEELVAAVRLGSRDGIRTWLRDTMDGWDGVRPHIISATQAAAVDPELRELVHMWFEEAMGDIREGLDRAGRFEPDTRYTRAVLALSQLDQLAQRWTRHGWDVDRDQALELLTDSWMHLLSGCGAPGDGDASATA
ncbi:TetR/AcrR family transcriptional regulator [Nocardiopsis halotolerans]|uniref:TetR/AcrR family transcriptional regulator n=1 Tax=Nocardiopsis halotolerans TaxID=124252 RepID=UPI0003470123|nr:TetR/AcrR family transcriptional regulator [Nocardiopsis halotolerans]